MYYLEFHYLLKVHKLPIFWSLSTSLCHECGSVIITDGLYFIYAQFCYLVNSTSMTKLKCLMTTELSKCGDVAVKCCLKKPLITKQTFFGHKILFLRIRMTICVKMNVDFLLS